MPVAEPLPQIADARRLAERLARDEPLVERVLLFGSVARGDAGEDSDYDLVVLLRDEAADGFNGTARRLRGTVSQAGRALFGRASDVVVRLVSDWEHTTGNVSASFDAAIVEEAIELVARPDGSGNRRRAGRTTTPTIVPGVPVDNIDEAVSLINSANIPLEDMRARLRQIAADEATYSDEAAKLANRQQRYASVLSHAHLAIELAVKSLVASSGGKVVKTHDINNRVEAIRDTAIRNTVSDLVAGIREPDDEITDYRIGVYHIDRDDWQHRLTADKAALFARTAAQVVAFAAGDLLRQPTGPENRAKAARAKATADAVAGLGVTPTLLETGVDRPRRSLGGGA
ncbi:MAG: HEPN domain-containing protein [Acidimicrobiaceae bacterium]|nr:HEPN domain-containing protein [Acidimicrobiaceae bacterium]MXZ98575.1 HEPN domain-containing protein [Acidimicrobiaceae bacterium]MYE75095.1 HEPN domain-containing protein [Acidimicrobiaceae bacterium]MYE97533.1 HEPN domain-containing protein [Acidimicrobiaceae bacterium]MYH43709.1 HEPN domain-containing protein [Acidimicrobiaceae bacterium]